MGLPDKERNAGIHNERSGLHVRALTTRGLWPANEVDSGRAAMRIGVVDTTFRIIVACDGAVEVDGRN